MERSTHAARAHPAVRAIPFALALWTAMMIALTIPAQADLRAGLSTGTMKLGHTAMFFGWTVLVGLYTMVYRGNWSLRLPRLFLATVVFGAAIEILQTALPFGRTGSVIDILWNSAGAAPACVVLWLIRTHLKKRHDRVRHGPVQTTYHPEPGSASSDIEL